MSDTRNGFSLGDFFTLHTDPRQADGMAFRMCSLYYNTDLPGFLCAAVTPATRGQIIVEELLPELLLPVRPSRVPSLTAHFPVVQRYYSAPLPAEYEPFVLRPGDIVTLRGADAQVEWNREGFEHYMAFAVGVPGSDRCNLISPIGPCQRVLYDVPVADTRFVPPHRAMCHRARFPALLEEPYVDEEHRVPELYVRQFLGAGICNDAL